MHWFWKVTDGFTPDQQILFLILLKPMAWLSLAAIAIGASLYTIWQFVVSFILPATTMENSTREIGQWAKQNRTRMR